MSDVEQPADAGLAPPPPPPPPPPPTAAADAAGLVAVDPAEAVVAEGQLQEAVVLRAADVRAGGRGPQLDDRHPPAAGRPPSPARRAAAARTAGAASTGAQHRVHQGERRQDQERLQRLGRGSARPNADTRPAPATSSGRPPGRAARSRRRTDHQQAQQRVRVVEPEHQRRDRRQASTAARDQPGRRR